MSPGIQLCSVHSRAAPSGSSSLRAPQLLAASYAGQFTTSGVLVEKDGQRFVNCASHGFSPGKEDVFHPNADGVHFGRVVRRLENTDMALIELQPDIQYTNQMFQNSINNHPPTFTSIRGANADDGDRLRRYETLYMDTPYIGTVEGVYLGMRLDVIPSDQPGHPVRWVTSSWMWFEDLGTATTVTDGMSGSVIWDSEGCVVSFLRLHGQAAGGRNCILGTASV